MLSNINLELEKAIDHLKNELAKLQIWRANPSLIEWILVYSYWSNQPIKNLASVSILDSQTLSIQPWDKGILKDIDKWITESWLWLNPQNNWESILIKIPTLTQERRQELVKIAKKIGEDNKITIRNIRHEYLKKIKQAETNKEIWEDISKMQEKELQKHIDDKIKKVDELLENKEIEIMKV